MIFSLLACTLTVPVAPGNAPAALPSAPSNAPASYSRACRADADCAAVYAIAGLDQPPANPAAVECGDLCTTAILAVDVPAWNADRARLEPLVACSKKRARCASLTTVRGACLRGECTVLGH